MERPKKDEMLPHCKRAGPQEQGSDRPNLPAAAIDGDDDLQVRLDLGADAVEHCLGCGRSMPADSTARSARGASRC